jgi:hypothetical protein
MVLMACIRNGGRRGRVARLSPATEFTTLVHEYAHELLHHADDRPASRDTRELEAEAVAFVVGGPVDSTRPMRHATTSTCIAAIGMRCRLRGIAFSAQRR